MPKSGFAICARDGTVQECVRSRLDSGAAGTRSNPWQGPKCGCSH